MKIVGGQRTTEGHYNDVVELLSAYTGENEDVESEMNLSLTEQEFNIPTPYRIHEY